MNSMGMIKKNLTDERNIGDRVPNLTQDTDVLNIQCDLTSDSLVDGEECDINFQFWYINFKSIISICFRTSPYDF